MRVTDSWKDTMSIVHNNVLDKKLQGLVFSNGVASSETVGVSAFSGQYASYFSALLLLLIRALYLSVINNSEMMFLLLFSYPSLNHNSGALSGLLSCLFLLSKS